MIRSQRKRTTFLVLVAVLCLASTALAGSQQEKAAEDGASDGLLSLPNAQLWTGPPPVAPDVVPASDGMRIAVDSRTGALRAPTVREARELSRQARELAGGTMRSVSAPLEVRYPDGTIMLEIGPDLLNYSVLQLTADGSFVGACVDGSQEPSFHSHAVSASVVGEE